MTLEPKFHEIIPQTDPQEGIFFDTFLFPSGQENLGNLCMIGEVRNVSEKTNFVIHILATTIRREYFGQPKQSSQESFRASLRKANATLSELCRQRYDEWLGNLRFSICAIQQEKILGSTLGGGKILLLREGELEDIGKETLIQETSFFSHTIKGKVRNGDTLILVNRYPEEIRGRKQLTFDHLKKILTEAQRPTAAIIIQFQEMLKVKMYPTLSQDRTFKIAKERRLGSAFAAAGERLAKLTLAFPKAFSKVFSNSKTFFKTPSRVKKLILGLNLSILKKLPKFDAPKQKKALALFVILFFLASAAVLIVQNSKNNQRFAELVERAQKNLLEAEAVLIYGDRQKASFLLEEAQALAEKIIRQDPKNKTAQEIKEKALKSLRDIFGIVSTESWQALLDFKKLPVNFHPGEIAVLTLGEEEVVFLTDSNSPGFYRYNLKTGQGKFVFGDLAASGFSDLTLLENESKLVVFINPQSIMLYDPQKDSFLDGQAQEIETARVATYRNNIYILNREQGKILKLANISNTLPKPQAWTKRSYTALTKSKDFALDGGLWTIAEDNQLYYFEGGFLKKTLEIKGLPKESRLEKIFTKENEELIFLLIPDADRLIGVDKKTGEIKKQYLGLPWREAKAFWLAENKDVAYVVNQQYLLKVELPQ